MTHWPSWCFPILADLVVQYGVDRRQRRGARAHLYVESGGVIQRKLERVARERELERERARIAQDIHDDLGASLTRIGNVEPVGGGRFE